MTFKLRSIEEVRVRIEEKKKAGAKEAWFFGSHITKLDADQLEKDGCTVSASSFHGRPNFRVSW